MKLGGKQHGPVVVARGPLQERREARLNPTVEHGYWRDNFASRPYADRSIAYDEISSVNSQTP